jgi:hypothetical protein
VRTDGEHLIVTMSFLEKLEGFRGNVVVALRNVASIEAVENPWASLRGIRAPGTGLPGVIAVGTRRGRFGKDFACVHGNGGAVVVELSHAPYKRLVVTVALPTDVVDAIRAAKDRLTGPTPPN